MNTTEANNKRVYISGKVTGTKDYQERFAIKEIELNQQGFIAVNPVKSAKSLIDAVGSENLQWSDYMKFDLGLMLTCNCIYMLKGWQDSRGAQIEHNLAKELNYEIEYEE